MDTTHSSSNTSIPETPPSSPNLSSRPLLVTRPVTWRLSSLESILEYKEAADQEKKGAISVTSSQITPSEEVAANVSHRRRFRSTAAEIAFCFSMALTQLLAVSLSSFARSQPVLTRAGIHDFRLRSCASNITGPLLERNNVRLLACYHPVIGTMCYSVLNSSALRHVRWLSYLHACCTMVLYLVCRCWLQHFSHTP